MPRIWVTEKVPTVIKERNDARTTRAYLAKLDLLDTKHGRLTIDNIEITTRADRGRLKIEYVAHCTCDCGNSTKARVDNMLQGKHKTLSCGCLNAENRKTNHLKSGIWKAGNEHVKREYNRLYLINDRCYNPDNKRYDSYGGRGIYVDDSWRPDVVGLETALENFMRDMGPQPTRLHQIDRENNDGPYSPKNCRWATEVDQANNRRSNMLYKFKGKQLTQIEFAKALAETYEVPYEPISNKLRGKRRLTVRQAIDWVWARKMNSQPQVLPPRRTQLSTNYEQRF